MEFHSNVHELFKKVRDSRKINREGFNDEDNNFANLDVEEDVMESLKDDIEIMKEKFHEYYAIKADDPLSLAHHEMRTSLQKFLNNLISMVKKNLMMKRNQLIVFRNQPSRT